MTNPDNDIAYPNYPLTLEEGEEKLKDAVRQFHASIVQARNNNNSDKEFPNNIAIKAAAGLGKTSEVIRELCVGQVKYQKEVHVEYYVPTHNLSTQLADDLKKEYQLHAERINDNERPSINVAVIKGRLQTDDAGSLLCNKKEQVNDLVKMGYSVASKLCKNDSGQCGYYVNCGYQKQFKAQIIDTKGITLPAVTIMTHAQLFHERHSFLPKPDFVVIDESFYQAGIEEISVSNILEILSSEEGEPSNVLKAIRDFVLDDKPLLKSLRKLKVTREDMLKEAKRFSHKNINNINPKQSAEEQTLKIKENVPKYEKFDYVLTHLADELTNSNRDDSYLFHVDKNNNEQLVFKKRKEINLPSGVPILFIDADLNEDVIKLFRPDTKVINIPVERKATIHQFSKTLSEYSRKSNKDVINEINTFLGLVNQDKSTLIVTTKKLREELTKETKAQMKQTGKYENTSINHFANLRGLNEFKHFNRVIIIDRNQPTNEHLEQRAKALWFDTDINITTCKDKGEQTYPRRKSGLRMKDHSKQSVNVSYHPDKHVQALLRIHREAEITQALDRLRLLRGNNNDRQVFIATSIPVDITVDYYWDWNLLQRIIKLLEISSILPFNPEHFLRVFPNDKVKSKRGAEDLVKNLNTTLPLIRRLISNYVLFEYKHNESRKRARALISSDITNPKEVLENTLGVTTSEVKAI
tara:strand:- start:2019 stop:4106 length:2088 start_codon:yes stop_codon:yes gene_type:complete